MSAYTEKRETLDQTTILDWIDRLREMTKQAPWAGLLEFEGVDALDVLLSPIYLTVLNAMRQGAAGPNPAPRTMWDRAHNRAFQAKNLLRNRTAARRSARPELADVLFWSRDITHTVVFLPLAQALREQGARAGLMACQSTVFRPLRDRDPSAVFSRAAFASPLRQARAEGTRRARQLSRFGPWRVPGLARTQCTGMEAVARHAVIEQLPLVAEAVATTHAALDAFGAKLLVVGNDLTVEGRAACRVAALRGISTAVFMHGSITGDALQARHVADRVFVYGNIHRLELVKQGVPPERIVVCGAPNLDQRSIQSGRVDPAIAAYVGLRPDEPWVLVATSGPGHRISRSHHQAVVEQLARLSAALPDIKVVIKLHHKDRLEHYQHALKESTANRLVVVGERTPGVPRDVFHWLQGCPLVLTGASTVAVEAMLMGVPVVTMDFCNEVNGVDFIDARATVHVRTGEELHDAVRNILVRGASEEVRSCAAAYLKEAFFALDGRSSERAATSLLEMIHFSGPRSRES